MAQAAGVRADSWATEVPSRSLDVREPHHASGVKASEPHASAAKTESKPKRSAAATSSGVLGAGTGVQ